MYDLSKYGTSLEVGLRRSLPESRGTTGRRLSLSTYFEILERRERRGHRIRLLKIIIASKLEQVRSAIGFNLRAAGKDCRRGR